MTILARFQKVNGWQRIWILVSLFLLILIAPMSHRNQYEETAQSEYKFYKINFEKMENLNCLEGEKSRLVGYVSCDGIVDYTDESKFLSKPMVITRMAELKSEMRTELFKNLSNWLISISILYGIGLIFRWIRRGGL